MRAFPDQLRPARRARARQSTTHAIAAMALVAAVSSAGCATGVSSSEISEFPIAFVYHTEAEARRRAEAYAEREAQAYDPRSQSENRGVVNVNEFKDYLESAYGYGSDQKHRGRMALLDARDRDLTVVAHSQPGAIPHAWSSDHQRLLFSQGDPGASQLYEYDRGTGLVGQLTHGPNIHPQGCYTSEGRIVLTQYSVASGTTSQVTSRLAIRSPAGQIETISSGPADGDPACALDGNRVAFVRVFGGRPQIWVQDLTGDAAARPVTPGYDPAFSPDGQWIVFGRGKGTSRLWRVRPDGAGRTKLGIGAAAEEYRPAVSPDGRFVVYESVLENRSRLFLRRFDGSGDAMLFSAGDGTHAVW